MAFDVETLGELPGLLAGWLPGAVEVGDLTDAELTGALAAIGAVRRELDASAALIAATVARRSTRDLGTAGLAQRRGHKDGAGLIEELAGVGRGEAAKLIRVGGLLETAHAVAPAPAEPRADGGGGEPGADGGLLPVWHPPERDITVLRGLPGPWHAPVAVALQNRWLTAAHSDALRVGLGSPPGSSSGPSAGDSPAAVESSELAQRWRAAALDLISDCWAGQWSPEDLARAAKRMRAALDGAVACAEAHERYELRSFKRSLRTSGMVHYEIDLDPESDARFYGPIKRLLSPRFGGPRFTTTPELDDAKRLEADPRSNEQLQVDTLVELIDRAVVADGNELFKTAEPQVMVAVTSADLAKAHAAEGAMRRHDRGDHAACGRTLGARCPGPDAGIAWIDGRDEPVTALDALRMICASGYTPALFDETGQAIDLGKDQRLFTRRQRRALAKRDGGCLHPGCDRPPEDCEAHHINPWAKRPSHRTTEIRDGVLLCRRHHKLIHDHGAPVERRDGSYWLHWPGRDARRLQSKAGVQTQLRARHVAGPGPGAGARPVTSTVTVTDRGTDTDTDTDTGTGTGTGTGTDRRVEPCRV